MKKFQRTVVVVQKMAFVFFQYLSQSSKNFRDLQWALLCFFSWIFFGTNMFDLEEYQYYPQFGCYYYFHRRLNVGV